MGRWPRATVLVLCLMLFRSLPAAADAFTDFRIPDHSWRSFGWDVSGFADRTDVGNGNTESEGLSSSARVATAANWFRDAERLRASHTIRAAMDGSWDRSESRWTNIYYDGFQTFEEERRTRSPRDLTTVSAFGEMQWTHYPEAARWFYRLAARGDARWMRGMARSDDMRLFADTTDRTVVLDEFGSVRRDDRYLVSSDIGIGLGHVRDATGVFKVERIIERLRDGGRLVREPSSDARRRLSEIFYVSGGYSVVHDLPQKSFWREVERVLREDGAISEHGLEAYALLRAIEPLVVAAGRFSRPTGWELGPIARFEHSHSLQRATYSQVVRRTVNDSLVGGFERIYSSRDGSGEDSFLAGVRADWHRPLGLRTQLDATSEAVCGVGSPDARTMVSSRLSISRSVGERWFLVAAAQQLRNWVEGDPGISDWSTQLDLGAEYFLEDRWSLSLTASQSQGRIRFSSYGLPLFRRHTRLTAGVSFNRGAFDAHGLTDPVRPLN